MRWGRPYVLVRWAGCDASRDTWEPLDNLTNCEAAIAAFERASGRPLPRPAPPPPAVAAPLPIPPAGFTMMLRRRVISAQSSSVGRTLLYWWPTDGWQRGTVARLSPRGAFSHAVAYTRQTRGTADTLLDAASYGHRWVLLSPAPAAGVDRDAASSPIARRTRRRPGPPALTFTEVGRWLVTAAGPGPGRAGCCVLFESP